MIAFVRFVLTSVLFGAFSLFGAIAALTVLHSMV